MNCILCNSGSEAFFSGRNGDYFRCPVCYGTFLSPEHFPDPATEKARYETHNNDVTDAGYQAFVAPLVDAIDRSHLPKHRGLDFGCGTGPVIKHLLEEKGFHIEIYDPFFHKDTSVLSRQYDYIACCEVIEHFHDPNFEFKRLFALLKPGGKLYCYTHLLADETDFENWYYKDDLTHVFFYHPQTIEFIAKAFGFADYHIDDRLVIFSKSDA